MKKQLVYLFLITVFTVKTSFAMAVSDYAQLSGKTTLPWVKEVKLLQVEEGEMVVLSTTKVNAAGEFGFSVPVTNPGFYYLDYGQMPRKFLHVRFYLEPKLDFSITINENEYVLSGAKIGQNALVQQANKIYDSFSKYALPGNGETYETFYPFLEKEGLSKANNFIKSINTKDANFNKLLALAVQTDIEELTFLSFLMPRSKHPEKNNRPAIMKEWIVDKKFTDKNLLKLGNGVSFMSSYFVYQSLQSTTPPDRYGTIVENISHMTEPALKEVYIRARLSNGRHNKEQYEKIVPALYPYLTSEKSKDLLLDIEKNFHKEVGQKGVAFTYNDTNDKPVSFSDFKGKYVYVDLWATWCAPCKVEIPHLKKLEEEYRGKEIVFVSVSLDRAKDIQKWKDFVKKEQLSGVQLMADKDFDSAVAKNYDVNAIPRFLLFDKQGNIVTIDALRPSDPLLKEQLAGLLK